ncbi:FeoB-associated Cys-rich membrane protein [bacterium]|nr:FeoB-associated Cys-rich membrane protein [bacterium]
MIDHEVLTGIVIVAGALLLVVRQVRRELTEKPESACGSGCTGCPVAGKEPGTEPRP